MPRLRFTPPRTVENLSQVQRTFRDLSEDLSALPLREILDGVALTDFSPLADSFQRVSATAAGLRAVLPSAKAENKGSKIELFLEHMQGTLTIEASPGQTVNGFGSVALTASGMLVLYSNGVDSWASAAQLAGPPGAQGAAGATTEPGLEFPLDDDGPTWLTIPGPQGIQGLQGVAGPISAGLPFTLEDDVFPPPVPFQWSDVLGAGNHSGPNNGFVDAGQFLNFGAVGPTTTNPQIRSGDGVFNIRGSGAIAVVAETGGISIVSVAGGNATLQAQASGNNAVLSSIGGSVNLNTSSTDRVVIGNTGEWTTPAGTSGQVWTHQGAGTSPLWKTPAASSASTPQPPGFAGFVDADELQPGMFSVPLGWSAVLAASRNSGPNNPLIDPGQFIDFGLSSGVPGTGDIRKAGAFALTTATSLLFQEVGSLNAVSLNSSSLLLRAVNGGVSTLEARSDTGLKITSTAAGTGAGWLRLIEDSASTPSLAAGEGMYWVKNTLGTTPQFTDDENADWGIGFAAPSVITADVTISGTTTTAIVSFAVPANVWQVGTTYRLRANVIYAHTAVSTTNPSFRIRNNTAAQLTQTFTVPPTAGNYFFSIEAVITCRTTGATGRIDGTMTILVPTGAAAVTPAAGSMQTFGAASNLNTTATSTWDLAADLASAVAGNTLTIKNATVERLK